VVTRSRGRRYRTWHSSTILFAHIGGTPDEQVRLDGMQIENSIAYQSSTIRILTDTPVLAEKNGFPGFPSWYWWRVRLMLEALAALAFPTGLSVQFGDQASRLNTTTVIKLMALPLLWPGVPGSILRCPRQSDCRTLDSTRYVAGRWEPTAQHSFSDAAQVTTHTVTRTPARSNLPRGAT
jgi:hypothetical protein